MPVVNALNSRDRHEIARLGPSEDGQLLSAQFRSDSLSFDKSGTPPLRARTSRLTHEVHRLGPRLLGQDRFTQACCSCEMDCSAASGDCARAQADAKPKRAPSAIDTRLCIVEFKEPNAKAQLPTTRAAGWRSTAATCYAVFLTISLPMVIALRTILLASSNTSNSAPSASTPPGVTSCTTASMS